jgi:hypothetical protein
MTKEEERDVRAAIDRLIEGRIQALKSAHAIAPLGPRPPKAMRELPGTVGKEFEKTMLRLTDQMIAEVNRVDGHIDNFRNTDVIEG